MHTILILLLVVAVGLLIREVRNHRRDLETLFRLRAEDAAGSVELHGTIEETAPAPDALDIARREIETHEMNYHKR